jgi:hypothetical protein
MQELVVQVNAFVNQTIICTAVDAGIQIGYLIKDIWHVLTDDGC